MDNNQLRRLCDRFRGELRAALIRTGSARVVVAALAFLALVLFLDWLVQFATPWRLILLLLFLAGLGNLLWWTVLKPLRRRWDDRQVFAYLDSVIPREQAMLLDLHDLALGEAVEETQGEVGRLLAEQAMAELAPLAGAANPALAVQKKRVGRWLKWAAATGLVFLGLAVPLHEYAVIGLVRFFNPFSAMRWPHRTTIEIAQPDNGWTVPQMESLQVRGRVLGVRPAEVTLAYRNKSAGYWIKERIRLPADGIIAYSFPEVREPLSFYVAGGDDRTDTYRVGVIQRPYLRRIRAHYDYPAYSGVPDRMVESGQLAGLEGTSVRLEFETSMEIEKALFILGGAAPEELKQTGARTFERTLLLESNTAYRVELYEKHGYREPKPEKYDIQVIPDQPPEVAIMSPGADLLVTRRAAVDIEFYAKDDFGLQEVQFIYQAEGGEPAVLSDKITGPIRQRGLKSDARFTWHLSRTDLPESGKVRYWVRALDVNPTGRGVSRSAPYELALVRLSEFHLAKVEEAKRIDAEARIAWENQLQAWKLCAKWVAEGTGNEDDPIWTQMADHQNLSIRAARAMNLFMQELVQTYEQNDMSREFMSVRLNGIGEAVNKVTEEYHPKVGGIMRGAVPRTTEEATPAALSARRKAACSQMADPQKLALLHLERAIKKLFDWRDLQISTVRTTLLHEEQVTVRELTEKIAPRLLGAEKEDLADDDIARLITLGKRQQTMFDIETELEGQLVFMQAKAKKQERKSIQMPLSVAYKVLRDRRVNDNLKRAAAFIANNQPYQIIDSQKAAAAALDVVKGGLVVAGQQVDKDVPITLAMVPTETLGEVIEKGDVALQEQPEAGTEEAGSPGGTGILTPEQMLAALPMGSDRLSAALRVAMDLEGSTVARTRYLSANNGPSEMPRYVRLKQGILASYQSRARKSSDVAIEEARKAKAGAIEQMLGQVNTELDASSRLIDSLVLNEHAQQFQKDAQDSFRNMIQHVALNKAVSDAVEENQRMGGKDAFGRDYVVRSNDLDRVLGAVYAIADAALVEQNLLGKASRWATYLPQDKLLADIEARQRQDAAKLSARVRDMLKGMGSVNAALSDRVRPAVEKAGLPSVGASVAGDRAFDKAAAAELKTKSESFVGLLAQAMRDLRDLLEERERDAVAIEAEQPIEFKQISEEEFQRMREAPYLRERIASGSGIPDEVRAIMLRSLQKEFPAKHKDLIAAYYASFLDRETVKK
jgi:hypothetical protein